MAERRNLERRLAAVLAADVAGYSRLTGADEEGTVSRLRALRAEPIDPAIARHRGRIVKTTGDGMLVEFASVVDAARCALDVQRAMAIRNEDFVPEKRITFRIGIHLGDVLVESDGDLMGDGVNIAARLEGICEPGGIVLSEDAYRQVRDRLQETFTDLGERALKNIARPVRVYAIAPQSNAATPAKAGVHHADAAPAAAPHQATLRVASPPPAGEGRLGGGPEAAPTLALPDKPSIAVLPFQNMSGDPEQDYFCDGMVEDIVTGLARINWLFVIARNSSFAYKGKSPDIRQVGRELGVRYVMEGSARKGGNRLRINCQLIEAETGAHVWADRYDGALEDVFELQDRITESVVGVIEPNVRRAEIERARRKPPGNLGAYDLYLRALPYFASVMPGDAAIGMGLLEEALKLDPNYAAAHAYLAWGLNSRVVRGGFNRADAIAGVGHAREALAHGGDDTTALAIAALPLLHLGGDFAAASGAIARALAVNGSCAAALYFGAHIHALSGDPTLAEDYANRALRLSPFDPLSWDAYLVLGVVSLRGRRFDEAASWYAKAVQANPRFSTIYACQVAALALAGRPEEAKSVARRLLELEPGFRIRPLVDFFNRFTRPGLMELLADGMRLTGLPE